MVSKRALSAALLLAGPLLVSAQSTVAAGAATTPAAPAEAQAGAVAETQAKEPRLFRGNDQVLLPASAAGRVEGGSISFKFEDAPILDVVHLVLRDVAKVNYVLHPPLNGSVTLATRAEVSADQAVQLLEAALQANGLQLSRDARGTYHVGKPEVLRTIVPGVRQAVQGAPLPPGYGAVIVQLKYIGAAEMATILRPMLTPESLVRVDNVRNLLVLVGTRTQAEGWLDLINTFDMDLLKGMSVGIIPLKHVSASEVEAALRLLAPGGASAAGGGASPTGNRAPAAAGAAPAGSGAAQAPSGLPEAFPLFGAVRVLPLERLNSVLVVTPRAAYLDEVRAWVEKLDKPGLSGSEPQLYVYPVQNGNAGHLASVIGGLFGTGQASAPRASGTGVAPSLGPAFGTTSGFGGATGTVGSAGAGGSLGSAGNSMGFGQQLQSGAARTGATTAPAPAAMTLERGVRIMADELNNAVLVYATRAEYEKIEATLKRLDLPPTQVLIEASIIEVTLTDDLKYGLQWLFSDSARNGLTGQGVLSSLAGGALAQPASGFSYTLSRAAGDVRVVLNALATKSLVKVISSPSLMVLDNHTASIAVGNQQPIRTGETITTGGIVTNSFQYKDTGVNLSVTPSVNSGNMVTMQLLQAVTDVGGVDEATQQRAFLQRQISSKIAVRSGETIVLGGLIKDNTTNGRNGVPLLQDLPVVGNLFGTNSVNNNRTELLVVITPRVVRSDVDLREVGAELRDRMSRAVTDWAPKPPAGNSATPR